MKKDSTSGSSHYASDLNELLEQLDPHVDLLARKKVPRNVVSFDLLYDEIEELKQSIRIKLWKQSQKQQIVNPIAYTNSIARTEAVDRVRKQKLTLPLPESEDGAVQLMNQAGVQSEELQDPAERLLREEAEAKRMTTLIKTIQALPPVQQHALLYTLKERIDDVLPLVDALKNVGIDVEMASQPDDRNMASFRTSLSIARKKLRAALKNIEE